MEYSIGDISITLSGNSLKLIGKNNGMFIMEEMSNIYRTCRRSFMTRNQLEFIGFYDYKCRKFSTNELDEVLNSPYFHWIKNGEVYYVENENGVWIEYLGDNVNNTNKYTKEDIITINKTLDNNILFIVHEGYYKGEYFTSKCKSN